VSVGATLVASFLAVLDRPSTWPLALVAFLVRGGWLIVIAPIVVLPTAVGLANVVAPLLEDIAFGRRTDELVRTVLLVSLLAVAWLLAGGLVAAVAETEAVRRIAPDALDHPGRAVAGGIAGPAWRVVAVRLAAHAPFVLALAWGASRIVAVGYRELTVPSDVTVPPAWRIAIGAPEAIAVVVVTWLVGEAVGAIGARRVILGGDGAAAALRGASGRFVRAPVRPLALALLSTAVLAATLGMTGLATGATWDALRSALAIEDAPTVITVLLFVFVALFIGGLVLVALTAAWRMAIWTFEAVRDGGGTFGGGAAIRSGD
jgi:hypothetical protein